MPLPDTPDSQREGPGFRHTPEARGLLLFECNCLGRGKNGGLRLQVYSTMPRLPASAMEAMPSRRRGRVWRRRPSLGRASRLRGSRSQRELRTEHQGIIREPLPPVARSLPPKKIQITIAVRIWTTGIHRNPMRALIDVNPSPEQLNILSDAGSGFRLIRGAAGSGKTTAALLRLRQLCGSRLARRDRLGLEEPVRGLVLTFNRTLRGYVLNLAKEQVTGSNDSF